MRTLKDLYVRLEKLEQATAPPSRWRRIMYHCELNAPEEEDKAAEAAAIAEEEAENGPILESDSLIIVRIVNSPKTQPNAPAEEAPAILPKG